MTKQRFAALTEYLHGLGPIAVAVSGGVDSMTLAYVAHRENPLSEMFHALSPAVPDQATERVKRYAKREGWQLKLIDAGEIHDPSYLANPANRCYFCKTNLYDSVVTHTPLTVVSGTNIDDLGDYRPGLIAAEEHNVKHPYIEVNIDKETLRAIAKHLGLNDLHDLPSAPCLSSRVTTGIPIDPTMLPLINEVEHALWEHLQPHLALKAVRCRIRPGAIVIEVDTPLPLNQDADYAEQAINTVREIFSRGDHGDRARLVTIEPYQRGSAFLIETLEVS